MQDVWQGRMRHVDMIMEHAWHSELFMTRGLWMKWIAYFNEVLCFFFLVRFFFVCVSFKGNLCPQTCALSSVRNRKGKPKWSLLSPRVAIILSTVWFQGESREYGIGLFRCHPNKDGKLYDFLFQNIRHSYPYPLYKALKEAPRAHRAEECPRKLSRQQYDM